MTIGQRRLAVTCAAVLAGIVLLGSSCKLANKAPSVPILSGPNTGVAGVALTFTATATDPESDSLQFQFDWGDGSTPVWTSLVASGDTVTAINTYSDSGTFTIKAKAKDKSGNESGWSAGQLLSLIPAAPQFPDSIVGSVYVGWPVTSCGMPADGSLLCIGSPSVDSLSILRVSDRTLLPRIAIGAGVGALGLSNDGRYAYISSWSSDSTLRVDVLQQRVVARVPLPGHPRALAVTPDGIRLLVGVASKVIIMRADSLATLDSVPLASPVTGMALSESGTTLYVTTRHGVAVVDVPSCSLRTSTRDVDYPYYPVLSPDEQLLYVFSGADSGVTALRTSDMSVTRRVSLHIDGASDMRESQDGAHIYLGYGGIHILDTRTLLPVDSVNPVSGGLIQPHPAGDSVYYVGGSTVYVIAKRH